MKKTPVPKYTLRRDADDSREFWLFLNYGGGEFSGYDIRWRIWWRDNDFFLVPLEQFHHNSFSLFPKEMALAKMAIRQLQAFYNI